MDGDRYLLIEAGGAGYVLALDAVREILPIPELARPPECGRELAGLLAIDGALVPVVCVARLAGQPEPKIGLYTPVVMLRAEPMVALLVDRVHEIVTVAQGAILDLPAEHGAVGFVAAELRHGDRSAFLLDSEAIVRRFGPAPRAERVTA